MFASSVSSSWPYLSASYSLKNSNGVSRVCIARQVVGWPSSSRLPSSVKREWKITSSVPSSPRSISQLRDPTRLATHPVRRVVNSTSSRVSKQVYYKPYKITHRTCMNPSPSSSRIAGSLIFPRIIVPYDVGALRHSTRSSRMLNATRSASEIPAARDHMRGSCLFQSCRDLRISDLIVCSTTSNASNAFSVG